MKQEIASCQEGIRHTHGCAAPFEETIPVKETFQGKTIWEGNVHSFKVKHSSGAKICFAWTEPADTGERVIAVLADPPITTARQAVQAALVAKIRGNTQF